VQRNKTIVPLDKRDRANLIETHILIYCGLAEVDAKSSHPELPLNLLDHLQCHVFVLFLLHPLFSNESGCTRMSLVMQDLALPIVLEVHLLLMGGFSRLPRWRRDSDGSSHQNWCYCHQRHPRHMLGDRQEQHCSCGCRLRTRSIFAFSFLGLTAHLLNMDSIGGLEIQVHLCYHCRGDCNSCGRVCLTGREEVAAFLAQPLTLYSFLFKNMYKRQKVGSANNATREKGKNYGEAPL
jgi:hypothetical protein